MAHRHAEEHVARDHARELAGQRARELAGAEHADRYATAAADLKNLAALRTRQADNKRELGDIDRRLAHARDNNGSMAPDDRVALQRRRDKLRAENAQIEEWANAPKYAEARSVAARGAQAPPMDDRDVQRWVQQRRWDTDHRAWDDDANLRAAGIDPSVHRAAVQRASVPGNTADRDLVAQHRQASTEQMRRDRVLLAAAHDQRDAPPMARAERRARIRYAEGTQGQRRTDEQVELQARAERRRIRSERQRARVYR
jgi:hypothetical protein